MVTSQEIAWAAGFLEGEGTFGGNAQISACQVQREPLERLQRYLGGAVTGPYVWNSDRVRGYKTKPIYHWNVCGAAALGVVMTVYGFLSPRRKEQAKGYLARNMKRANRHRWHTQLKLEIA